MWMETQSHLYAMKLKTICRKKSCIKKSLVDLWFDLLVWTALFYICQCTHLINVMRLESVRACECCSALASNAIVFDHFRYYFIVNISFNNAAMLL